MPELPEVETVRRSLEKYLINKTIKNVEIYYPNIILNELDFFKNNIKGQKIISLKRRGKWLIFELNDYYLISHLRMEGKYYINDIGSEITKHTHVVFNIEDEFLLFYCDTRKFGRMKLIDKNELEENINVGLEPFDNKLTINYLKDKYMKIKLPIKTVLLDQKIIAGIGNIYANEILFKARITPFKKAQELTDKELELIIKNTKDILNEAITLGGSTIKSYEAVGKHGGYQEQLCVHSKEGIACQVCGCKIIKTTINGRGTYYCEKCQK